MFTTSSRGWGCAFAKGTKATAAAEWDSRSSFSPSSLLLPGQFPACSSHRHAHPASLDSGCLQHVRSYSLPDEMSGILTGLCCHYQSQLGKRLLSRWPKPFLAQLLVTWGIFCSFSDLDVQVFQMLWAIHRAGLDAQTAGGSSYSKENKRENNEFLEQHWPLQEEHPSSNEHSDIYGNPQAGLDIVVVSTTVSLFMMFYFCLPSKTNHCN